MGELFHRSTSSRPQLRSQRILLSWMLCLTAWRGPIPLCHSHEALARDVAAAPSAYAHWMRYHESRETPGDHADEWHWHWVFPSELFPDGQGQGDLEGSSRPTVCVSQVDWLESPGLTWSSCLSQNTSTVTAFLPLQIRSPLDDPGESRWRSRGFLNTFADEIDARSLTGVALC